MLTSEDNSEIKRNLLDHCDMPDMPPGDLPPGHENTETADSTAEREDAHHKVMEEERAVEELRARRDQLQGMVDENDFDMEELRMLGVHMDGAGEEM